MIKGFSMGKNMGLDSVVAELFLNIPSDHQSRNGALCGLAAEYHRRRKICEDKRNKLANSGKNLPWSALIDNMILLEKKMGYINFSSHSKQTTIQNFKHNKEESLNCSSSNLKQAEQVYYVWNT